MKKPPLITQHIVNMGVSALAREIGVSPAAVSKKMKAGMTVEQIRQAAAQRKGLPPGPKPKNKPPAKQGNSHGPGRPPLPNEYDLVVKGRERMDALDVMKFRRAKALAERSELDNMLKRGELIPVAYIRTWGSRFLTDGRDALLAGPSELQDTLAAETDPLKVNAVLRLWLERVMAKFHQLESLWEGEAREKVA